MAELIVRELSVEHPVFHLAGVVAARDRLTEMGFVAPGWEALANGERPDVNSLVDAAPGVPKHGWQHKAAQKADDFFMSTSDWHRLQESSRACDHKEDPCLDCFSLAAPLRSTARSKPNFSESCSFAVFGSPFPPLLAPDGVAVLATPLATTVQRARTWGCWVGEALPWRVQRLVCVAKLVAVSQSTLQFATSTLECLTRPMRVGWKSWLTAFLCFTGPSLGWTPLSCLCCAGTGHLTLGVQTKMEQFWQLLAAARKRAVLNWLVNTGAPGWSSPEVGGRWSEECRQFLCLLAKAKVRSEPKIMRSRAKQAWLLLWGSFLACSSARAFAMSLLERRGGMGADGPTPSTDDVVWEARFSAL